MLESVFHAPFGNSERQVGAGLSASAKTLMITAATLNQKSNHGIPGQELHRSLALSLTYFLCSAQGSDWQVEWLVWCLPGSLASTCAGFP